MSREKKSLCVELLKSIQCGDIDKVNFFLGKGCDPNYIVDDQGWTLLHVAVAEDIPEAVRSLLKHGANPMVVTKEGDTPLYFSVCITQPSLEIARLLIGHGANLDYRRPSDARYPGRTALHCASQDGSLEHLNLLLQAGANVHVIDDSGALALHYAKTPEKVRALCQAGAYVDAIDLNFHTPLFLAVREKMLDVAKELVRWGADPDFAGSKIPWNGLTPRELAGSDFALDAFSAFDRTKLNVSLPMFFTSKAETKMRKRI